MIGKPPATMSAVVNILAPLDASTKAPDQRPTQYVRVSRVGGGMINPVTDKARVLVECWAESTVNAETLANDARYLLCNAGGKSFAGVFIRWCSEVSGPVDFPDTVGPRFQFIVELLAATV